MAKDFLKTTNTILNEAEAPTPAPKKTAKKKEEAELEKVFANLTDEERAKLAQMAADKEHRYSKLTGAEKKCARLSLVLRPSVLEKGRAAAKEAGTSLTDFIEAAILEKIERK